MSHAARSPVQRTSIPTDRDFFVDNYSAIGKPVVVLNLAKVMIEMRKEDEDTKKSTPAASLPAASLPAVLATCLSEHAPGSTFSLRRDCPHALDQFYRVPNFFSEDALQHVLATAGSAGGGGAAAGGVLEEASAWPTAWQSDTKETSLPLTQASAGAHVMLIVLTGKINVRLYDAKDHEKLMRRVGAGGVRVYDDDNNDQDGGEEENAYRSIQVEAPDALFVPSGFVYGWSTEEEERTEERSTEEEERTEERTKERTIVVSHGFVDAGAVSHMKDEIMLESRRSGGGDGREGNGERIGDDEMSVARRLLSGMHGKDMPFARESERSETTTSWHDYLKQGSSEEDEEGKEKEEGEEDTTTTKKKKKKKRNYREWRMQKVWEKNMLALVPPVPSSVNVVHVGWTEIHVRVVLPFGNQSTFHSVHQGFDVIWSTLQNDEDDDGEKKEGDVRVVTTSAVAKTTLGDQKIDVHQDCTIEQKEEKNSMEDSTSYICVVQSLLPGTKYLFRLATWTTTGTVGASSSPPLAIATRALAPPPRLPRPTKCPTMETSNRPFSSSHSTTNQFQGLTDGEREFFFFFFLFFSFFSFFFFWDLSFFNARMIF